MRAKFVSEKSKNEHKLVLRLYPDKTSKTDIKVAKSIALALVGNRPYLGSGPTHKGKATSVYFEGLQKSSGISETEYQKAVDSYVEPPWRTAPEVRAVLEAEQILATEKEYQRSVHTVQLAKELGADKLIPKKIRAKHTCRCGATYKNKPKLRIHQKLCSVLREEEPFFKYLEGLRRRLADESTRKEKQTSKAAHKQVQPKALRRKLKRKKDTKTSSKKASRRH